MKFPAQLVSAWRARSLREQVLLSALAALFAALAFWYGAALPLRHAAAVASLHRAEAAQKLADVVLAVRMNAEAQGVAPLSEGGLEEAVKASAMVSGIAIERIRMGNPSEITVFAGGIEPAAFFSWVRVLEKAHGVRPADMTAARDDSGLLSVEVRFAGGRG
jgi:type II secretory pathway component PulM